MFLWLIFTEQEKRDRFRHFITCNRVLHGECLQTCVCMIILFHEHRNTQDKTEQNTYINLS